MLSVLLLGFDAAGRRAAAPGDAVRTLTAFVPAAVEAVVRDLCLAGPEGAGLAEIADHAGCIFAPASDIRGAIRAGSRLLRGPQVLVLHAGTVVDRAVVDELASLLPLLGDPNRSAWVLKAASTSLAARVLSKFAPTAGVICARTALERSDAASLPRLARQISGLRTMRSTAVLSP